MIADTITAIKKALKKVYIGEWYIAGVRTNGLSVVLNAADSSMFNITAETFEAEYVVAANPLAITELLSTLESLQRENAELRKKLAGCDWYWPEDDTSSDACADSVWSIAEAYDLKPADVLAYSRGGVVETRYFAFLPPADDSDSDDNFEVDEPTEEAVSAKITSEIERRTALASTGGEHHAE